MSILKMDQVVSVFENSSTKINYTYVNNEGDSRGYTIGRAGFTTVDGDFLTVVMKYIEFAPVNNILTPFISILKNLCDNDSDSTKELDALSFKEVFATACNDQLFIKAQDTMVDITYFNPATLCAEYYFGAPSEFVLLCFYDCAVQHGFGDNGTKTPDPDSLCDIALRSLAVNGSILDFLRIRRMVLLNPQDHSTKKEWSESVGRVDALIALYSTGNFDLVTPFPITVFGDSFVITGE